VLPNHHDGRRPAVGRFHRERPERPQTQLIRG
jgi:hypothetical protein